MPLNVVRRTTHITDFCDGTTRRYENFFSGLRTYCAYLNDLADRRQRHRPETAVYATVAADGEQIAVGSADGHSTIWQKASDGSWRLVSLAVAGCPAPWAWLSSPT